LQCAVVLYRPAYIDAGAAHQHVLQPLHLRFVQVRILCAQLCGTPTFLVVDVDDQEMQQGSAQKVQLHVDVKTGYFYERSVEIFVISIIRKHNLY